MRMLVTGKQMKAIDAYTIHTIGIPSLVLRHRQQRGRRRGGSQNASSKRISGACISGGKSG